MYVQGHFRWLNNPEGRDSEGTGAVKRRGLDALDPVNGQALAWNPDKPAQQGGFAFLATATGLWVGSDSPRSVTNLTRVSHTSRCLRARMPFAAKAVPT